VLAWLWLDIGTRLQGQHGPQATGMGFALRYFFAHELPKVNAWLAPVSGRDATCLQAPADSF
jgi:butyryl-CoA dehydrogenase